MGGLVGQAGRRGALADGAADDVGAVPSAQVLEGARGAQVQLGDLRVVVSGQRGGCGFGVGFGAFGNVDGVDQAVLMRVERVGEVWVDGEEGGEVGEAVGCVGRWSVGVVGFG